MSTVNFHNNWIFCRKRHARRQCTVIRTSVYVHVYSLRRLLVTFVCLPPCDSIMSRRSGVWTITLSVATLGFTRISRPGSSQRIKLVISRQAIIWRSNGAFQTQRVLLATNDSGSANIVLIFSAAGEIGQTDYDTQTDRSRMKAWRLDQPSIDPDAINFAV